MDFVSDVLTNFVPSTYPFQRSAHPLKTVGGFSAGFAVPLNSKPNSTAALNQPQLL